MGQREKREKHGCNNVKTWDTVTTTWDDLGGGRGGGVGDSCESVCGHGCPDRADMLVPHDQRAGGNNAQPAYHGPAARGGIRPGDVGGGGADVVEVDQCSIEGGGSASDGGGLGAPTGCGGNIGNSGGGSVGSLGVPVPIVRMSWKPMAGTTMGMTPARMDMACGRQLVMAVLNNSQTMVQVRTAEITATIVVPEPPVEAHSAASTATNLLGPCPSCPGNIDERGSFDRRNSRLALPRERIPYTPTYAPTCLWNNPVRSIRGGATSPLSHSGLVSHFSK